MFNFSAFIPVHLIQKPIEYALIILCLAAIAQFYYFAFSNMPDITLDWFIVALILIIASLLMVIRFNSQLPFFAIFLLGGSAFLVFLNPDFEAYYSLLIMSLYSLLFWLFWHYFLNTTIFLKLYQIINQEETIQYKKILNFISLCFYLSFFVLNGCVILALAFDLNVSYYLPILIISLAIIFLFVAEKFISEQGRGVLLPLYISLILISLIEGYSYVLWLWCFVLWGSDNGISAFYNKKVPSKKIETDLWPWYGLLLVFWMLFNSFPQSFINIDHLSLLVLYLFLMLRNSTLLGLRHLFVIAIFSLFVVFILPIQSMNNLSILMSDYYAQAFLFFALLLLVFNVLWDAYINPALMPMGWKQVSLRPMIIVISFSIGLFYLILITITAPSFIAYGFYSNYFLDIQISFQVILLFFVLYLFIANKLLAHLNHFSLMLMFIILAQGNKNIPVHLLFALFYIFWIILPLLLRHLFNTENRTLPYYLQWDADTLIDTSMTWVIVSFIASLIALMYEMNVYTVYINLIEIFFSLLLLFIGAIVLVKYKKYTKMADFWHLMAYLLMLGLILSMRSLLMGSRSFNEFDTIGILIISLIFYKIRQGSFLSSNIINAPRLALVLPVLSLFTIPWSIGSVQSSLTLFVLGGFYLAIQNNPNFKKNKGFIQYGAFLLLNLAVYLWMPYLSNTTGLLLFYAIPVTVSVFLITSLHKHEIKSDLQYQVRLVTLGLFYLVIVSDVFMNDSLVVFIIALLIALFSIAYGISSRTRAFLYTGIGFMVLIIMDQLILFYPEGRLARALILMLLGAIITGAMIGVNIKRELFLSRIRLLRADLLDWD